MTRREAREQAFMLVFENLFTNLHISDIKSNAEDSRDIVLDDFAFFLSSSVISKREEIDNIISENLKNWKIGRLPKVVKAIMRISVYEILYLKDIPVSVSINEAIEIAKKFSTNEDAAFINGVLGGLVDKMQIGR